MNPQPAPVLNENLAARVPALAQEFASATPFKHVVIDEMFAPEFFDQLAAQFPKYDAVRFRNSRGDAAKAERSDVRALGPAFVALDETFRSERFLTQMSRITGIPNLLFDPAYFGAGTHENINDMDMFPHVDFNSRDGLYRRLNFLIYLNADWHEDWGGCLQLHENPYPAQRRDKIKTIAMGYNRCVVFETTDRSWHGFERLRLPAGVNRTRRSFALYLYTRERPENVRRIPPDLTMFVDRPLPERFNQAGYTLTAADTAELARQVVERDLRIEYLYDRALDWHRQAIDAQGTKPDVLRDLAVELAKTKRNPG